MTKCTQAAMLYADNVVYECCADIENLSIHDQWSCLYRVESCTIVFLGRLPHVFGDFWRTHITFYSLQKNPVKQKHRH